MYKILMLSAVALFLVGCTATGTQSSSKRVTSDIDWEQVAAVERANRNASVPSRVIWVNPPRKNKTIEQLIEERRQERCADATC